MKVLESFSIKGLRRFQNLLFLAGFLLLPLVFFTGLLGKYFLSLSFIAIFLAFRKAEKIKSRKVRHYQQKHENVHELCLKELHLMEKLFLQKGYSIELYENEILHSLYQEFDACHSVEEFHSLYEKLLKRILFVSELKNNENKKYKTHKQEKQQKRSMDTMTASTQVKESLRILDLPEGTTDMVSIKKAYKKLIKKYHPDINPSAEAGKRTIQLNLAYEQLKNNVEAS